MGYSKTTMELGVDSTYAEVSHLNARIRTKTKLWCRACRKVAGNISIIDKLEVTNDELRPSVL